MAKHLPSGRKFFQLQLLDPIHAQYRSSRALVVSLGRILGAHLRECILLGMDHAHLLYFSSGDLCHESSSV